MDSPEIKILIGVPDQEEAALIKGVLSELGYYNTTIVENGPDAASLAELGAARIIIAVWELPNLGGLRLVRMVRKKDHSADIPCVLIVPQFHESEINMAEGAGVDYFLARPLTRDKIEEMVGKIIGGAKDSGWPDGFEENAENLTDSGDLASALDVYNQALESGRRRMAGLNMEMGSVYQKQGRTEEAIVHFENASLLDPLMPRAQAALGMAYLEANRPAEAGRALERASKLDPMNDEIKLNLAESWLLSGKNVKAEKLFGELLDKNPENMHLLNRMGIALRKQGKYTQAIGHYSLAISINDQDEHLFFNLSRCYYETGDLKKALDAVNQSLYINPAFEQARQLLGEIGKIIKEAKG